MEPEEFLDPSKRVYDYDQVITEQDLRNAIDVLFMELASVPASHTLERHGIMIAIKSFDVLLEWIVKGKPGDFNIEL